MDSLYHLSFPRYRESILQHGLQPSTPDTTEQPAGVYVVESQDELEEACILLEVDDDEELDVWEIAREDIQELRVDPLLEHMYYIPHVAPATLLGPYEG